MPVGVKPGCKVWKCPCPKIVALMDAIYFKPSAAEPLPFHILIREWS